jgi:hypothetical protein
MDKLILKIIPAFLDKLRLFFHYFPYELIKHELGISINIEHKESKPMLSISILYILIT